jgi:DNA-binding response OmpR family regulator
MASKRVVLLVDDHTDIHDMFRQAAARLSLELVTAEDGQEGLDQAKAMLPALMVIRRDVPILNAQSVSVLLKQSPDTEKIPVMVICSRLSEEDQESFRDAGCNDCIKEPLDEDKIVAKLKEWLKL